MELVNSLNICIKNNRKIIQQIRTLRNEFNEYGKVCFAAKTVGTDRMVGSAVLMSAPFTGGVSVAIWGTASLIFTISGAALNIISDISYNKKTSEYAEQMNRLIVSRTSDLEICAKLLNKISGQIADGIRNGETEEVAFHKVFYQLAGISGTKSIARSSASCLALNSFYCIIQFFKENVMYFRAAGSLILYPGMRALLCGVGKGALLCGILKDATSTVGTVSKTVFTGATSTAGTVSKTLLRGASFGVGAVFIAIDVGLIIQEFASENTQNKYANKIETELEKQICVQDNLRKSLLTWLGQIAPTNQGS